MKIKEIVRNKKLFWIGGLIISIWLGFYVDFLVDEDFQLFIKMGIKYTLIVLGIILGEIIYKKILRYF